MKVQDEKLEAITARIQPMLDCIGLQPPTGSSQLPSDMPYQSVIDRCQVAWSNFKQFMHSAAHGAIVHALTQLQSHYPSVDLQRLVTGYARGSDANKIARLEDEVEESTKRLAKDVELFGEGGSSAS